MPFGLCDASATLEHLMENVLRALSEKKCVGYLDDVVVFGKIFGEHLENLEEVFNCLIEANLEIQISATIATKYTEKTNTKTGAGAEK